MTNPNAAITGALRSPRTLAVWGLLGYTALFLFFAFFSWVLPNGGPFASRSAGMPFTELFVMAMPVVAVLLAAKLSPVLPGAKLIATIALLEYVVALGFGVLTYLIGLGAMVDFSFSQGLGVLHYLVMGIAELALVAIAGYATYQVFTSVGGKFSINLGSSTPNPGAPARHSREDTTQQFPTQPGPESPYQGGYTEEPPTRSF